MIKPLRLALAGAVALFATACATSPSRSNPAPVAVAADKGDELNLSAEIAERLASSAHSGRNLRVHDAVARFYAQRAHAPAWFNRNGDARAAIGTLLDALARVERHGLIADDYGYSTLVRRIEFLNARTSAARAVGVAATDIELSRAFVAYAMDLQRGRVDPGALRQSWQNQRDPTDYARTLARAIEQNSMNDALAAFTPPHKGYTLLRQALADYRAIADAGGWPRIAAGDTLETGRLSTRVQALRQRLRISGDLPPEVTAADMADDGTHGLSTLETDKPSAVMPASLYFGPRLATAVRHFQQRHGLSVDGRVGPRTRTALNVPARARVKQIELNLERWRWLPADPGERYILVNIPEYRLRAFEGGAPQLVMDVIVGQSYDDRTTPVFADRMRYVVFHPFWNIPYSIALEEILPRARRDPGYLALHQYQIVRAFGPHAATLPATAENLDAIESGRLQLRQAGGPYNALGQAKFMFPNEYAVYLHGTPATRLFSRTRRDFSHGCVRVQDPAALAAFVLEGRDDWPTARINRALHADIRKRVNLAAPVPVYLIYWTAFVTGDGVEFRNDVYQHDPRLETAIDRARANGAL